MEAARLWEVGDDELRKVMLSSGGRGNGAMWTGHFTVPTHAHIFVTAHFTRDHTCGSSIVICCESSQKHFIVGHVVVEHSFDPRFLLFSPHLWPHWRHLLSHLRCQLASRPQPCTALLGRNSLALWPAHSDQFSEQKHEFPARVRRDDHRFRGPELASTSWSFKQQPAVGSKLNSQFVETRWIGD